MAKYKMVPLGENVEEMFIGPFGSSLKNENFVDFNEAYCMVYEQKHAIKKTMNLPTRYINKEKYDELKRFNIQGGDIIVSCRGTIGETYIIPDDAPLGIMHPSIMKIRLKEGIYDKYYFNLLLNSRLNKHKVEANGSGIKMAISATELGKELFPVPTMDEQLKIADIIFKISDIVKKRIKELDTLDELVKARFVEMFGSISDGRFEMKTLPEIVNDDKKSIKRGPFGGALKKEDFVEDGYLVYEQRHAIHNDFNYAKYYITKEKYENMIGFKVVPGDLIISCSGTLGRIAEVPKSAKEGIINQALLKISLNQDIMLNTFFIQQFRGEEIQEILFGFSRGSGIPNMPSMSEVKAVKFICPPIELQNQFADFVYQIDKSKVAVQKALDEAQLLFDSLMQEYFG